MESRFSGSSILPFNIIIAKWGETGEFAIPAHTSSKKKLSGRFPEQPENFFGNRRNGDFAWDFLGKNSPVPFPATGEC